MSAAGDFTTTPQERQGSPPPYTDPSIQVNLVFRVLFGIGAILAIAVPAKLLWRHGEFAAAAFCIITMILNLFYVINALIWPDNNVQNWYAGYGWCDFQTYVVFALTTAYNICLFEVMRSLANKVGLLRVTSLTSSERRRKSLISALIIFPIPLLQVIFTYFVILRRYNVSTLIGCTAIYDPDWLFFLFFILPPPLFIFGAAGMAGESSPRKPWSLPVLTRMRPGLVYWRFREIDRVAREVIHSGDSVRSSSRHRIRRKLYFTSIAIMVFVLPLDTYFFVQNIPEGFPWTIPYDYGRIHFGPDPFNINFISFTTTDLLGFGDLNINYISVITAIPIFIVFGTTIESLNLYRKCFLAVGLDYIFPSLRHDIQPKRRTSSKQSWWATLFARDSTRSR
jgi:pheromone a factor receptor